MTQSLGSASDAVQRRKNTLQVQLGRQYWTFDRTGRFLFMAEPGRAVRRGLDHRMVESVAKQADGWRTYRDLSVNEKDDLLAAGYAQISALLAVQTTPERAWLSRIVRWQGKSLAADRQAFSRVYKPVSILPPDHYKSLVVQVTEGCSYNRCTFCDFYQDRPFRIKTRQQLGDHVQAIKDFFGERLMDRTGVFLGDGNALIVPQARLLDMLAFMRAQLRELPAGFSFSTFMDTFNLDKKSLAELRVLHEQGLQSVYVGLESGNDELRMALHKPGTSVEAARAIINLKAAGFRVGVILLVGVGGSAFAERHFGDSLNVLRTLPFTAGDIVYLSPFVAPENPDYGRLLADSGADAWTQLETFQQTRVWQATIAQTIKGPTVSLYSIQQHIY